MLCVGDICFRPALYGGKAVADPCSENTSGPHRFLPSLSKAPHTTAGRIARTRRKTYAASEDSNRNAGEFLVLPGPSDSATYLLHLSSKAYIYGERRSYSLFSRKCALRIYLCGIWVHANAQVRASPHFLHNSTDKSRATLVAYKLHELHPHRLRITRAHTPNAASRMKP